MYFENEMLLPFLFLIVLIFISFGSLIWRVEKRTKERKQKAIEFVGILINAFYNKALKDPSDLVAFYESHFGRTYQAVKMYTEIHLFLEQALLRIGSSQPQSYENLLVNRLDELRQLISSIQELLKEEEKRVPFYGTPDLERSLLVDILELTASDKDLVNVKLTRLAELIKARQDTINVIGEEKGKVRKLAFWGIAGTAFFGIASIILGIIQYIQAKGGAP